MSPQTPSVEEITQNCLFCAWLIRDGQKPPVVYEDDNLIATLCEAPITKGHTQIVFKTHYNELALVDCDDSARMGALIPRLAAAIKKGLGAEMIYVACISEEVRHVHFHLVPRYVEDRGCKGFGLFTRDRIKLENIEKTIETLKQSLLEADN